MKNFLALGLSFGLFTALPGQASAQLMPSGSKEPVDITGDTAEFQDQEAVWTGNVRVVQGEAILTAERLNAAFNDDGGFKTITAVGQVRYSNGKEAITGGRAVYDDATRTITITEDVIVTQGKQVMSAGKIVYWVDTGKVLFTPEAGKRIRGLFFTGEKNEQS